jgi:hypothetical protein
MNKPLVLYRFVSDLQAENRVGLDVDHDMDSDPVAPDLPLPPHPFTRVGDPNSGTADGDADILGEDPRV